MRDRAILLLGFAGAMRRSELATLQLADAVETGDGLRITVGRSKTDQEGEGAVVGIAYGSNPPTCPMRAERQDLANITISRCVAHSDTPKSSFTPRTPAGTYDRANAHREQ